MVGLYDYMKGYCVCPGGVIIVGMLDLEGNETSEYPVHVYNVDEVEIGIANNKAEYITKWNSDPTNQEIGILSGFKGPFTFLLNLLPGQYIDHVIGDPDGLITGFLETEDGFIIVDETGQAIEGE